MKKKSLKTRIKDHLDKSGEWINGSFYEKKAMDEGKKASNASRRLRELAQDGLIERQEFKSSKGRSSVFYRSLQPKKKFAIYTIINGEREFKGYRYE